MAGRRRRSERTSDPAARTAPEPDLFLAALEAMPSPLATSPDGAEAAPVRALPPELAYDIRRGAVLVLSTGLLVALCIGGVRVFGIEPIAGMTSGVLAVILGFVHLGALANLVFNGPRWLRAWGRVRWLERLDRRLAATPLRIHTAPGLARTALAGPDGILAQLTQRRGRRSVAYEAHCRAVEGLTVSLEVPGQPVVDGAVQATTRVSTAAHEALSALLERGARVEDGHIFGTRRIADVVETAAALNALSRPGYDVEIPRARRPLLPVRTLAEDLPRHAALSVLRLASLGTAVAMVGRCNTLERTTIWSRDIRDGAYGAALAGLAFAVVAVIVSRGSWTPFVQGASRVWWHWRLARRLHRRGFRLTWTHGINHIYDPRDPRRSVEITPADDHWVFAAPLRGFSHSTLASGSGPDAIAGLRIAGDRVAAVIALTPDARALVLPVLATGATIRNGRIEGALPYDDLLDLALAHDHLFANEPDGPFERCAAARERMCSDPEARWRLACFEAALDVDPDEADAALQAARASGHPELQIVACVLGTADDSASTTRAAPVALEPLVAALGGDAPALVEAIAWIAARHRPADDARLIELGDCCPIARGALVGGMSDGASIVEAALVRWLGDAHDTPAAPIADALAEWGTAAALPALHEAARRTVGEPASRLERAERAIRARAFAGQDGGLALAAADGGELALAEEARDGQLALADDDAQD